MNPNEEILDPASAETPTDSPSDQITPDAVTGDNPTDAPASLSPEEESWKNLSGPAQERFRQVTRENNLLRQRLNLSAQNNPPVPAYKPDTTDPGVSDAVRRLSEVGIATDEKVEQVVNQRLGSLVYQMDLDRLASKYDGTNGLPQFDKDEYEDYIARHPQYRNYAPEDVYAKIYEPEILDYKLKHLEQPTTTTTTPSLRPTKTQVREEPLSPELIEQRLKEPDGPQWYARNIDKVNAFLAKQNVESW